MTAPYKKKLIEVALPLEAINKEAAREKSIRHGHPSTLHLWWARRPLAACRAVLFAQLVDDPDSDPQFRLSDGRVDLERAGIRRAELFNLIEELVQWENSNNPRILNAARAEIAASLASRKIFDTKEWKKDQLIEGAKAWDYVCRLAKPKQVDALLARHAPPVLDPFAGGGSIPLEAQRLGLRAHASDLNPVPVLINKALIEIPPKFAGRPPVNPKWRITDEDPKSGTTDEHGFTPMKKVKNPCPSVSIRGSELFARQWKGASGLAEDVRHYGQWMRDEAQKRIGHLYPKVAITREMAKDRPDLQPYIGQELTVIAWLWARTVPSPDPSMNGKHVPLVHSFWLSTKKGKEAYVRPIVDKTKGTYQFTVCLGKPTDGFDPDDGTKESRGASFHCVATGSPMSKAYVRGEFQAKRNSDVMMAIVCEGNRGRVYLPPSPDQEQLARTAAPNWKPDIAMNTKCKDLVSGRGYGITKWYEIFTPRQLTALTTFSDLVGEARAKVLADARAAWAGVESLNDGVEGLKQGAESLKQGAESLKQGVESLKQGAEGLKQGAKSLKHSAESLKQGVKPLGAGEMAAAEGSAGLSDDTRPLADGGQGPQAYADAVATYLAFGVGKCSDYWSTIATWATGEFVRGTFARQALPMTWDFAETNPVSASTGNWSSMCDWIASALADLPSSTAGKVMQISAANGGAYNREIVSTDPPYYDNIGYADLSDFFYVWLRRTLKEVYPQLLGTMLTPKTEEMIASPYRHGGNKAKASKFFEEGLGSAIGQWRQHGCADYPTTIFYAFKQAETDSAGTASTGWETFLSGVIDHGFAITGTWPMRTERTVRSVAIGTNALASSVVLACVPRADNAPAATRREFLNALKAELPEAMRKLQSGNIAPVDLAQAAIGPGMGVFSRYSQVLEADGSAMSVRGALVLINQMLDEVLAEQEGDLDRETAWAVAWFEQFGFKDGAFGDAEMLSKAKNTAVNALVQAGIVKTGAGKARLLRAEELPADWDPVTDARLTVWEMLHHLIRVLNSGGETAAAELVAKRDGAADAARELAYRLYSVCERRKRAADALAYNALVQSWPEIGRLARESGKPQQTQRQMFEQE